MGSAFFELSFDSVGSHKNYFLMLLKLLNLKGTFRDTHFLMRKTGDDHWWRCCWHYSEWSLEVAAEVEGVLALRCLREVEVGEAEGEAAGEIPPWRHFRSCGPECRWAPPVEGNPGRKEGR